MLMIGFLYRYYMAIKKTYVNSKVGDLSSGRKDWLLEILGVVLEVLTCNSVWDLSVSYLGEPSSARTKPPSLESIVSASSMLKP